MVRVVVITDVTPQKWPASTHARTHTSTPTHAITCTYPHTRDYVHANWQYLRRMIKIINIASSTMGRSMAIENCTKPPYKSQTIRHVKRKMAYYMT